MKAEICITYIDGTKETFIEGDFWTHQFKNDIESRNSEFIKIGSDYVRKSEIRSTRTILKKETEE